MMKNTEVAGFAERPLSKPAYEKQKRLRRRPTRRDYGYITILDRAGLEATACDRYLVIKDEYDRLLDLRTSLSLSSVYATPR
jgi:hypothetical protein